MAPKAPSSTSIPGDLPFLEHSKNVRRQPSNKTKRDSHLQRGPIHSLPNHPDIPPSVAALLEATAIPLLRKNRQAGRTRNTLQGRIGNAETPKRTPLNVLFNDAKGEIKSENIITNDGSSDSSASVTTSLTGSVPSVETDDDLSATTASSGPPTPGLPPSRSPFEKKHKQISQSEPCDSDPLLLSDDFPFPEEPQLSETGTASTERLNNFASFSPFPKLRETFKSNLSSSLRALKAAAQTVSNFTTPSVWVNDAPSQPILSISPELTDDKRPNLVNKMPSIALRRYLNPNALHTSSIHSYYKSSRGRHKPLPCVSSIQMQTYSSSSDQDGDVEICSNVSEPVNPALRHREVRENSDFLRMFVLELNMRRVGKFQSTYPGKAQVWLPPRKGESPVSRICSSETSCAVSIRSTVPSRWISLTVD